MDGTRGQRHTFIRPYRWHGVTPAGGTTRSFFYSDQWQVIEEREGSAVKATNAWSPALYVDALVYRDRDTDGNGSLDERIYPLHDANFNVTALTNSSGTVIERFIYDPYGSVTVLDANWATDADGQSDVGWVYLHQGGRFDWTTGLYHFRNRDYDPELGRWTRQDPAGYIDGMNAYNYVRNSPATLKDAFGLSPWAEVEKDATRKFAEIVHLLLQARVKLLELAYEYCKRERQQFEDIVAENNRFIQQMEQDIERIDSGPWTPLSDAEWEQYAWDAERNKRRKREAIEIARSQIAATSQKLCMCDELERKWKAAQEDEQKLDNALLHHEMGGEGMNSINNMKGY